MTPTIALSPRPGATLPWKIEELLAAAREYAALVGAVWNCPASIELHSPDMDDHPEVYWPLYLERRSDVPGAMAYHALDDAGPWGIAFLDTAEEAGLPPELGVFHELAEMMVDHSTMKVFQGPGLTYLAGEIVDPVEDSTFQASNGLTLPNFVYPSWFDFPTGAEGDFKYDHLNLCTMPFELLPGGYADVWTRQEGWKTWSADVRAQRKVAAKAELLLSRLTRRREAA